ncbi:MerR family transcriptional regulator [Streptomyces sp. NPDC049040]|uniref:MerR family transcriptional regulator n=1 Tax=Streptomyces sp. NPDC049040 TaxID=3365593 RepID=UPI00371B4C3F
MRISELASSSGVPIATIKYYIREGLLPAGRPVAANQADYGEDHLRRLRLVRALVAVRGLPVSTAADVLAVLGDGRGESVHRTLSRVLAAMDTARARDPAASDAGLAEVHGLVAAMGWHIPPRSAAVDALARALDALDQLGIRFGTRALLPYARLAERTARVDLDLLAAPAGGDPAEHAVLLAVLLEPALLVLRRMAQEHHSAAHGPDPAQPGGADRP